MNVLTLAVHAFHDATKLINVKCKFILKWFKYKFLEVHHNPGTFHCNVTKDFRFKTLIFGVTMESSNIKILSGFQSRALMRAKKSGFMILFIKKFYPPPA